MASCGGRIILQDGSPPPTELGRTERFASSRQLARGMHAVLVLDGEKKEGGRSRPKLMHASFA